MTRVLMLAALLFISSSSASYAQMGHPTNEPVHTQPVEDTARVLASYSVRLFMLESSGAYPVIEKALGAVSVNSCMHSDFSAAQTKGQLLKKLRLKALDMGANGIIDVTFDTRGMDMMCWGRSSASGVAVKFAVPAANPTP